MIQARKRQHKVQHRPHREEDEVCTIPAYLKDLFGGYNVSAIHGRLLTAWSTAGIVGPLIVNGVLDHYKAAGLNRMDGYRVVMHTMVALLVVGFVANLPVRPVAEKYWMKDEPAPGSYGPAHQEELWLRVKRVRRRLH